MFLGTGMTGMFFKNRDVLKNRDIIKEPGYYSKIQIFNIKQPGF